MLATAGGGSPRSARPYIPSSTRLPTAPWGLESSSVAVAGVVPRLDFACDFSLARTTVLHLNPGLTSGPAGHWLPTGTGFRPPSRSSTARHQFLSTLDGHFTASTPRNFFRRRPSRISRSRSPASRRRVRQRWHRLKLNVSGKVDGTTKRAVSGHAGNRVVKGSSMSHSVWTLEGVEHLGQRVGPVVDPPEDFAVRPANRVVMHSIDARQPRRCGHPLGNNGLDLVSPPVT